MMKCKSEIVRRLTADRNNHSDAPFSRINIDYCFDAYFVEVKPVADVGIRADRLRIEIQENRAVTQFSESAGGIHAAPVELYRATNAIRARPKDKDVLTFFVLDVISFSVEGQIEIVCLGWVFCCQGINLSYHRVYFHVLPVSPNGF